MKNFVGISLLICSFNVIGSVVFVLINDRWLKESGLFYLSDLPSRLFKYNLVSFSVVLVACIFFLVVPFKQIFYIVGSICFPIGILNFMYSFLWIIDPSSFFSTLNKEWNIRINSEELNFIQSNYKCCGFHTIGEKLNDKCKESQKNPCYRKILKHCSKNLTAAGASLLALGVSGFVLTFFVFLAAKTRSNEEKHKTIRLT